MRARSRQPPWSVSLFLALAAICACAPSEKLPQPQAVEEEPHAWDGPPVWVESPMVKIRPETAPGSQRELDLFAARNEFVSFQIGFHGGQTGLKVDSVSLSALKGELDLVTERDMTLYREALLDIAHPSAPNTQRGRWPDGLIPDVDEFTGEKRGAFPFEVPPGEARALWVDVHVPEDARPGRYEGSAWVTAAGGGRVEVKIHLQVVDARMPSTPSLKTAFFLAPNSVCSAYAVGQVCDEAEQMRLLLFFHRLGIEHRLTLAGGFGGMPRQAPWNLQDWNTFSEHWGPFLDGTTASRLPGAQMTSWQYVGPASADSLGDFVQETLARGWLHRAFDYVGDEPPLYISFEEVRQRATLTRQAAPELRTLLTTHIDLLEEHGLEELVDIVAVVVNFIDLVPPGNGDQRGRYTAFLSRPNRELWLYQSCMSHGCGTALPENQPGQGWPSYMIDRSAAKARAMEWVSFLEGATGELYYQTVEALDTAWRDQFRYNGNGDGTLFYPGLPSIIGGSTDVPVPSLRLKLIRLGLQDYEWLKAVSDAGDPEYARRVARKVVPSAWRVPDDGAIFETARLCLMRRYLELTEEPDNYLPMPPIGVPCPEGFDVPPAG